MNPLQAWKAKLDGVLFLGVHNVKKTSVVGTFEFSCFLPDSELFILFVENS